MARKSTAPADPSVQNFSTKEDLTAYLQTLETNTTDAANQAAQKMEISVTINGKPVRCTVTPPAKPGRKPYRLFYVEEKRIRSSTIPSVLLSA